MEEGIIEKGTMKDLDVSRKADTLELVANLIALEGHTEKLYYETQDTGYLEILKWVRVERAKLLAELSDNALKGDGWCLPGSMEIISNPSSKPISDVTTGDKVLTHNGWAEVSQTFSRDYEGDMVAISPYYGETLSLTPEHSVLCASGVRTKQKDLWRKNFEFPQLVWKQAKELKETDFLIFPRIHEEEDISEMELEYSYSHLGRYPKKQTKKIKVNENLMKLVGLYISEGSIFDEIRYNKSQKRNMRACSLFFSFGKHETELIEQTRVLFESIFGIPLRISQTHTNTDLCCSRRIILKFFAQFGKRSTEKQLPIWVFKLPKSKLSALLWGLVKGDGHEDKYQISYSTTSKKLAYQLRVLLFKIGILHSLKRLPLHDSIINGRKIIAKNQCFEITISGDSARQLSESGFNYNVKRTSGNFGYVLNDYVMIPIRKIERMPYLGKVYNIETNTSTYCTHTGVVHNCSSKHLLHSYILAKEVGAKFLKEENETRAKEMYALAKDLRDCFFTLYKKALQEKK